MSYCENDLRLKLLKHLDKMYFRVFTDISCIFCSLILIEVKSWMFCSQACQPTTIKFWEALTDHYKTSS